MQKTPVFIDDVTLTHLSHLFLGVPGGKVPGHFDTASHHSVDFFVSFVSLVAENPPAPNPKSLGVMLSDIREIFSESGVTKITL